LLLAEMERRCVALHLADFGCREIGALEGASYTSVNRHLARARR
jgi:DNA-directed RNA polymerase specialized sigma24 family protein